MQRICVVANSGAGKTSLARRLAQQLGLPHLELDGVNQAVAALGGRQVHGRTMSRRAISRL